MLREAVYYHTGKYNQTCEILRMRRMNTDTVSLYAQIIQQAHDPCRALGIFRGCDITLMPHTLITARPPIAEDMLQRVELELGFRLPFFLRSLYLRVGHGNFGPAYGLLGLVGTNSYTHEAILPLYADIRGREPDWPIQYVPIVNLGCGEYACVDCGVVSSPVLTYDRAFAADGGLLQEQWTMPLAPSLEAWFQEWLNSDLE
jgi:SMI1 / KNR4 family (SUKH-1)